MRTKAKGGTSLKKMGNQSIYVIESESGLVKIGIAKNPRARAAAISTQSGFKLKRTFFTDKCSNAGSVEHAAHTFFRNNRAHGEWFKIKFEDAVQKVKELFDAKAEPEEESTFGLALLFYAMHYSQDIVATSRHLCPKVSDELVSITVAAMKDWLQKGSPTCFLPIGKETLKELSEELEKYAPQNSLCYWGNLKASHPQ